MKLLIIHSRYTQSGGEDAMVAQELAVLSKEHTVTVSYFQNHSSWRGALQFLASVANFKAANKISKIINEQQPDVAHFHNTHFAIGPWVIRRVRKQHDIPMVMTLHNYRLLCPTATFLMEGQLNTESLHQPFPWTAVAKKAYRNSSLQTFWLAFITWMHAKLGSWSMIDRYLVLTPFAQRLFQENKLGIAAEKFVVKPNAIEDWGTGPEKRSERLLFVGRLSEEKGVHLIVEAALQANVKLDIVGDGPLLQDLQNKANNCGNITFHGKKSPAEVREMMKEASALVFPSIWYEGMPVTILEAFSVGTPVIASALGAMESMVVHGENGWLVPPGSVATWKTTMEAWMAQPENEKHSMQQAARACYQAQYTLEENKQMLTKIYTDLIVKGTSKRRSLLQNQAKKTITY